MLVVDLRSDTVTRPTQEMLHAMMEAKVGDDVLGDDPTVLTLQEKAAEMFGKEAALFCPSGTMCNQIAINILTKPRDEVICSSSSHVYLYEGGGMAFNSQVSARLIEGDRGRLKAAQIEKEINPDNEHFPNTSLVVLENTCNKGGGSIYAEEEIASISSLCRKKELRLHLDGARLFNAVIANGYPIKRLSAYFDTISVCLSKGLGAPVGSLLLGSKMQIREAIRLRKVLGGGMRQAGYLAAAGIYALDHHIERLEKDHERAKYLGDLLSNHPGILSVAPVDTNIIIFEPDPMWKSPFQLIAEMEAEGVRGIGFGPKHIRWVTHLDIDDSMIAYTEKVLKRIS